MTVSPCLPEAHRLSADDGFCARVGSAVSRASRRRQTYEETRSDVAAALYGAGDERGPISFRKFDPQRGPLAEYAAQAVFRAVREFEKRRQTEPSANAIPLDHWAPYLAVESAEDENAGALSDAAKERVRGLIAQLEHSACKAKLAYQFGLLNDALRLFRTTLDLGDLYMAVRYTGLKPQRVAAIRRYVVASVNATQKGQQPS